MPITAPLHQPQPQSDWFASWFDSAHCQRLYAHRDDREAAAFIDRLIQYLEPRIGAAVLDLGCGNGRHAKHLASRGFHVTGLDLSAESLALAKARPSAVARWVRQDMREPFGVGAFDYVLNLFTSFGYFMNPADHLTVVGNIARSLSPGGRVVVDYTNVHRAEAHLVREEIITRENVEYHVFRWSDADAIFKRIVIDERRGTPPREFVERVSKLTVDDFRFMLALYGLQVEELFGDYRLGAFDHAASPRLIAVASKA
jgi:SAM-dependent methyltransferase